MISCRGSARTYILLPGGAGLLGRDGLQMVVERLQGVIAEPAHVGEAAMVEDSGDYVAHLGHHQAYGTRGLVAAILAACIACPARSGERRERAVECPDHCAHHDPFGRARQHIAAVLAFPAGENAHVAEFAEDRVEKFFWDL